MSRRNGPHTLLPAHRRPYLDERLALAGLAMLGLLAGRDDGQAWPTPECLARRSLAYADALLRYGTVEERPCNCR